MSDPEPDIHHTSQMELDPNLITEVLLADGWHIVDRKVPSAFSVLPFALSGSGRSESGFALVELTGIDEGAPITFVAGPLTSVLAVKYRTNEGLKATTS